MGWLHTLAVLEAAVLREGIPRSESRYGGLGVF